VLGMLTKRSDEARVVVLPVDIAALPVPPAYGVCRLLQPRECVCAFCWCVCVHVPPAHGVCCLLQPCECVRASCWYVFVCLNACVCHLPTASAVYCNHVSVMCACVGVCVFVCVRVPPAHGECCLLQPRECMCACVGVCMCVCVRASVACPRRVLSIATT